MHLQIQTPAVACALAVVLAGCGLGKNVDSGAVIAPADDSVCSGDSTAIALDERPEHWDRTVGEAVAAVVGPHVGVLAVWDGTEATATLDLQVVDSEPGWTREDETGGDPPCTSIVFVDLGGTVAVEGVLEPVPVSGSRLSLRPDRVGRDILTADSFELLGDAVGFQHEAASLCTKIAGTGAPEEDWSGWTVSVGLCAVGVDWRRRSPGASASEERRMPVLSEDESNARFELGAGTLGPEG